MAKKPLARPVLEKPSAKESTSQPSTKLSNVNRNTNITTGESPKTVRLTAAEKAMCAKLVSDIQELTHKSITDSKIIRAALYIAKDQGPEKILEYIKDHL